MRTGHPTIRVGFRRGSMTAALLAVLLAGGCAPPGMSPLEQERQQLSETLQVPLNWVHQGPVVIETMGRRWMIGPAPEQMLYVHTYRGVIVGLKGPNLPVLPEMQSPDHPPLPDLEGRPETDRAALALAWALAHRLWPLARLEGVTWEVGVREIPPEERRGATHSVTFAVQGAEPRTYVSIQCNPQVRSVVAARAWGLERLLGESAGE